MIIGRIFRNGKECFIANCLAKKCDGAIVVPYEFKIQHGNCIKCGTPYKIRINKKGTVSINRTDV